MKNKGEIILKEELMENVEDVHWNSIESHATSPGFPDLVYTLDGVEGKIELKFSKNEVPKMRATQIRWIRKNIQFGGRPLVFAKIETDLVVYYLLFEGKDILKIYNNKELSRWKMYSCKNWTNEMNWVELKEYLFWR